MIPFKTPVSNLTQCAAFCPSSRHDDPYFMMLYINDTFRQQCGCSTMCALSQLGENMQRVSDEQCSFPCVETGALCGGADSIYSYFAVYSISPKSGACSETDVSVPLNRPVQVLSYAGLVLNVLLLFVFLYFVLKEEGSKEESSVQDKRGQRWKQMALSPFNIQLLMMTLSFIGIFACLIIETMRLDAVILSLLPVNHFLSATFKTFFVLYSWGRGSAVIHAVWSTGTQYFQAIIYATPVVIYSVVIAVTVYVNFYTKSAELKATCSLIIRTLDMSAIAAIFLIDFGLLVCFVTHIRQNTRISQTDPLSPRLVSICHYGIAANLFCIAAFVIFIDRFMSRDTSLHNAVPEYLTDAIIHLVFTGVLAILLGLKVSLQWESEREVKSRVSMQERAIVIASGGALDGISCDINSMQFVFE
ncbi:hypothetical protein BJ741DRAFT_667066 [Chytriomyces cf. hyalinus JEL632]|nr:hypothetical protein BJ741DRAFT_667066 [Chytriomyces cf. hyalinus JEL632]